MRKPRLRVRASEGHLGATQVVLSVSDGVDIYYAAMFVDLRTAWSAEDVLLDAVARLEHRLGVEV